METQVQNMNSTLANIPDLKDRITAVIDDHLDIRGRVIGDLDSVLSVLEAGVPAAEADLNFNATNWTREIEKHRHRRRP